MPLGGVRSTSALVAGAGPAGLAAAAALQRCGLEVAVLERDDAVGSSWRRRYDGLRLNTMRQFSGLPGLRIPRAAGRYPSRDDYAAYLEGYAAHHRLDVRFGTALERVEAREGEEWTVRTSVGEMRARYVVVATGYDAEPRMPDWVDPAAAIEVLHASEVRSLEPYRGRHVLVVGAGNTGVDLAGHLLAAGAEVSVAMRTPPNLFRRDLLGLPLQPSAILLDRLPSAIGDRVGYATQRLVFGNLTRHGIPRAPEGYQTRFRRTLTGAAVDDGFVDALKRGRTEVVAPVDRLDGGEAVLVDGRRLAPDLIVCATGYRRGLEALVGHLGVLRPDGLPINHHAAPEHPAAPGLFFAGFWGSNSGQLRFMPIHARRIARAVVRAERRQVPGGRGGRKPPPGGDSAGRPATVADGPDPKPRAIASGSSPSLRTRRSK